MKNSQRPEDISKEEQLEAFRLLLDGKYDQIEFFNSLGEWETYGNRKLPNRAILRLKPQPKYRAWKAEEVPVGGLVRRKDGIYRGLINGVSFVNFTTGEYRVFMQTGHSSDNFFEEWEHSTDNGKTWNPCGVVDVE